MARSQKLDRKIPEFIGTDSKIATTPSGDGGRRMTFIGAIGSKYGAL
jgi:hypothetical protein